MQSLTIFEESAISYVLWDWNTPMYDTDNNTTY